MHVDLWPHQGNHIPSWISLLSNTNHGIENEKEEARGDFGDKYDTLVSNVFS